MTIKTIYNNHNIKMNVISDLKKGDELIAKDSIVGKGDVGASGLCFEYNTFIIGKIYSVNRIFNWDGVRVGYVIDEDGTSRIATPEIFEVII